MTKKRPYKDKPWIVIESPNWFESLLGVTVRLYIDTTHSEWVNKVLAPAISKFSQSSILSKMHRE